jgi:hypothetical protein
MKMDLNEEKVKSSLERKWFTVERFSKEEMRACKTPDFRISRNGEFLFYCEVKSSPSDKWLDEQLNDTPCKLAKGARNDPIFNRLTTDIYEAVKQFDAVNIVLDPRRTRTDGCSSSWPRRYAHKKDLLSEEDPKQVFETAMMASSSEHASDDFERRAKRKSQETYNLYFYQEGDFQARLRNYREHYFKTQYNPSNYDQY